MDEQETTTSSTEASQTPVQVLVDIDSSYKLMHIRVASEQVLTKSNILAILENIADNISKSEEYEPGNLS